MLEDLVLQYNTMYSKDFIGWNIKKQQINALHYTKEFYIKPREIRMTTLGVNIGNETDGKGAFLRPVLILQKVGSVFRILPMTTKGKNNSNFYYKIESIDFKKPSYVILSQIRTINKKRCTDCIGTISTVEMQIIKKSLQKRIS